MKPQIIIPDSGIHNMDLAKTQARLLKGQSYKDLSTIIMCPTRPGKSLMPRVVSSWLGMMKPMNQQVIGPLFLQGFEVGDAYNSGVEMIFNNPVLSKWKYVLTLEEDNIIPPDGLLRLYESIEGQIDGEKYDAVGGLYWTKGEGGQPMCYGDPVNLPLNFRPWLPVPDSLARCNGLGMGFTLFRISMLKKITPPWFKTEQSYTPGVGARVYTQDLWFFEKAGSQGFKFACDTRVKVGHYDCDADQVW